ncbi:MAG: DUF58 domain-containing protein [Thermoplasmata archaeon]
MSGAPSHPLGWRPLTVTLIGVGAVLVFAAVLARDPVPIFVALPLLLAPIAAGVVGPRRSPRIRMSLSIEGAAAEVLLRGTIAPPPGVDARDLFVEFERPASLKERSPPTFERSESEVRFRVDWIAPEPIITEVRPPMVLWRDPMGLVERPTVSSAAPTVISRYPPELLRIGSVRLERTTPLPGESRSRRVGESGEFHGIRLARSDDSPRQINWRASARAGRPLANEYDLDKTGDILLLLDARPTPLGPTYDERLFSIVRAAALGLSDSFLRVKSRVGLGVFGEFLDVVPLSTGRTQRVRIESALREARISTVFAPAERCAVSVRRHFPPGLTTVVFSTLADESSTDLSPYLRRRGYPVVILSPSPLPLITAAFPLTGMDEQLARRIGSLVRRNRIAHSWQEAPTIDWDDYWSLGKFVEFVRRPRLRRAG